MSSITDVGDRCVECDRDTSFGSGLFVNRVSAGTETKTGYLCPDCQLWECDNVASLCWISLRHPTEMVSGATTAAGAA
jgi:hypothetical protein